MKDLDKNLLLRQLELSGRGAEERAKILEEFNTTELDHKDLITNVLNHQNMKGANLMVTNSQEDLLNLKLDTDHVQKIIEASMNSRFTGKTNFFIDFTKFLENRVDGDVKLLAKYYYEQLKVLSDGGAFNIIDSNADSLLSFMQIAFADNATGMKGFMDIVMPNKE